MGHNYEANIKCPYCDYEDQDSWELEPDEDVVECGNCSKEFNVQREYRCSECLELQDKEMESPYVCEGCEGKTILDKFPRVLYYLLDWKDKNMEQFTHRYNGRNLKDLSNLEIQDLFSQVSSRDILLMHKEV